METDRNLEAEGKFDYTDCTVAMANLDASNQDYFDFGAKTTENRSMYVVMAFPPKKNGHSADAVAVLRAAMYDFMDGQASKRRRRTKPHALVGRYEIKDLALGSSACATMSAAPVTTPAPTPATATQSNATPATAASVTAAPVNATPTPTAAPVSKDYIECQGFEVVFHYKHGEGLMVGTLEVRPSSNHSL